ncbi:MAG: hypothetical protein M3N07_06845 [Pseudomonadota bacterium]|nr:hypothetical protein [Pseudomonadota bacterium]
MTTFRSEELLVGFVAAALLPIIALRTLRGVREGRLPLYRTYIRREDDAAKFNVLVALHALSFVLIAVVAVDLLFGLGFREAL